MTNTKNAPKKKPSAPKKKPSTKKPAPKRKPSTKKPAAKKPAAKKTTKKPAAKKTTKKPAPPMPKKSDQFTIYGSSRCPWCMKAKDLLINNNIKHTYHDIDSIYNNCAINMSVALADLTSNQRTIPIVFYNGNHIGGYTELEKKFVF